MRKQIAKKTTPKSKPATTQKKTASTNITQIQELINFISKSGIHEVAIETTELKLHVKQSPEPIIKEISSPTAPLEQLPTPTPPPSPAATEKKASPKTEIKSPMIGTFYRSANPNSPPFVSTGNKIKKGQVICIIEAMKLFNEIESEMSGTIVDIVAENASPVEYDQVLFIIEPD